jgi:hypothetical protein
MQSCDNISMSIQLEKSNFPSLKITVMVSSSHFSLQKLDHGFQLCEISIFLMSLVAMPWTWGVKPNFKSWRWKIHPNISGTRMDDFLDRIIIQLPSRSSTLESPFERQRQKPTCDYDFRLKILQMCYGIFPVFRE